MLTWPTLRSRADFDHVAVGTSCLLVGSACLLLGIANPPDAWTLGMAAGLVVRVAFLLLGIAALLLGVAFLRPGRGTGRHTGQLALLLVDPDHRRQGLGSTLLRTILTSAAAGGLDRLDAQIPDAAGVPEFLGGFGFTQWGRRPGWIIGPDGGRLDELVMGALL